MKIIDYLLKLKNSSKIAVVEKEKSITYEELYECAQTYASIIKKTIRRRSNIAILLPNSAEYIKWYYAILLSGNIVVPIYFYSSNYEIQNIIHTADVAVLISGVGSYEKLQELVLSHKLQFLFSDNLLSNAFLAGEKRFPATKAGMETAVLLGTSGSTSNPKRVMLTDKNLITNANDIIESLQYSEDEVFLVLLPLMLASANTSQLIVSLLLSATVVIYQDIIHPNHIYEWMNQYGVTSCTVVASVMRLLLESRMHEKLPAESLKTLCFGGGPSDTENIRMIADGYSGINIVHMYGQTEAATRLTHLTQPYFKKKIGSVGKPIGNISIKIVDENGMECENGTEGEITVRGDNVMAGYYNQPELTSKTLRDGWLFTGDIGKLDCDGFLYITGRKKNVIIFSGVNIYPEEIEAVILQSGLIREVLVFGKSSPQYGEVPIANAVRKRESVTEAEILDFCKKLLPAYKVPQKINFIDRIEKTANGKIARRKI